jgi:hypothetical protein
MGWIGSALIILGAWQIGHKRRWTFLIAMSGGSCWIVQGILTNQIDLIFIESIMLFVSFRNFKKWRE